MILVVSNRQVNPNATDASLFGEAPNDKGIDELRLATAHWDSATSGWQLELLPEAAGTTGPAPSELLFRQIMAGIRAGTYRRQWVFYIHGFNQSFLQSLEASRQLAEIYHVDVILFSWPSNPGGFVTDEYKRARQAARASANAIDRTLEKLGSYLASRPLADLQACPVSLNLLVHSLGNYLVENFIRDPIFSGEMRIFDNIVFHQADVDNRLHRYWIDRLYYSRRIYVTINEEDLVLKASDFINPARLGNTLENLDARRPMYIDFTRAHHVGNAHNIFLEVRDNPSVREFFHRVLRGDRGEDIVGFQYDSRLNAFRLLG